MGTDQPSGPDRLNAVRGDLGCAGKKPLGGNRHVLIDPPSHAAALRQWTQRAAALPDFLIADACADARDLSLLGATAEQLLRGWLQEHRQCLWKLISDHRDELPAAKRRDLEGAKK